MGALQYSDVYFSERFLLLMVIFLILFIQKGHFYDTKVYGRLRKKSENDHSEQKSFGEITRRTIDLRGNVNEKEKEFGI